jgi:NADPH:quinone reductase-like Zn-dependent oxidoreductase
MRIRARGGVFVTVILVTAREKSLSTRQTPPRKTSGGVDLVFDVIGGDIQKRSLGLVRPGGTLVSVVGPA